MYLGHNMRPYMTYLPITGVSRLTAHIWMVFCIPARRPWCSNSKNRIRSLQSKGKLRACATYEVRKYYSNVISYWFQPLTRGFSRTTVCFFQANFFQANFFQANFFQIVRWRGLLKIQIIWKNGSAKSWTSRYVQGRFFLHFSVSTRGRQVSMQ